MFSCITIDIVYTVLDVIWRNTKYKRRKEFQNVKWKPIISYNIFSQIFLQNSAQYLVWCASWSYKIQFVELAW